MGDGKTIFTTEISFNKAGALLKRIAQGESVSVEERLEVVRSILAFSPRDWASDQELWLLFRAVFDNGSEEGERDVDYICRVCGGNIILDREEDGRKIYKCDGCESGEILECTKCHKPRSIWVDKERSICALCVLQYPDYVVFFGEELRALSWDLSIITLGIKPDTFYRKKIIAVNGALSRKANLSEPYQQQIDKSEIGG